MAAAHISISDMHRRVKLLEKRVANLESRLDSHISHGWHAERVYGNIPAEWELNIPTTTVTVTGRPCPDCAERQPCANVACPLLPKVT